MEIIDGKKLSRIKLAELKTRVQKLNFVPVFVDLIVGDDPVSLQYIGMKEKRARDIGIAVQRVSCALDSSTENIIQALQSALGHDHVCGAIVQLPMPSHIDTQAVLDNIPHDIDVDVLAAASGEKFYTGTSLLSFPAAQASFDLLQTVPHDLSVNVLVVGQGMLVGRPVTHMLRNAGYTVHVATKMQPVTSDMLSSADVIISATGVPNIITGEYIKPGVILIDAGTAESDGGIVGDIDTASVQGKAGYIAPVPGGVGPMTVALLLENVVISAEHRTI
ncbi:MAG: bifunctional 5,10-methylenetetrahydrofolate dehydrogenase/5,10-methenyltetrahydrofolate cyclohydrolase [Candidatus Pacebacteria bacterium]|nr:bifunctional 5,10-methylenetetrahydrofolate dehydrogenase/5,10-methenyltetrahydrofolate cyclohydrolase [Candidatus Paceibacterota bacterium]